MAGNREGVNNLVVVPACCGKILCGAGLCVSDALGLDLVDGGGNTVHVRGDSLTVVENGLAGCAAAGEPAENQTREQEDEQHREHQEDNDRSQQLFPVLPRRQGQTCRRAVGPAHGGAFGGGGDSLAGLDGTVNGVGGAGGLVQAAFFMVVQAETPRLWINSMVEW